MLKAKKPIDGENEIQLREVHKELMRHSVGLLLHLFVAFSILTHSCALLFPCFFSIIYTVYIYTVGMENIQTPLNV